MCCWIRLAPLTLLMAGLAMASDEPRPLSQNCQAKLPLTEEVTRLLTKAAAHTTSSSACIDGPGERVVVDQVLVCPVGRAKGGVEVDATYQVTRWAEGDTRMCGQNLIEPTPKRPGGKAEPPQTEPDLCAGTPGKSKHRMRFRFERKGKDLVIRIPKAIDGLPGMTSLDKVHSGGCYGKSGPFKPARIRL